MINTLARLPDKRSAWLALFATSFALILTAMYFQYGMDLQPCIKCIYQRTATFGLVLAGLIPLIANNMITRLLGFSIWGTSAIWGMLIAIEHVDIQTAANPFFVTCEFVPNFPEFLALHEWLPSLFAATGDCGDIDWQFLGMSMPQWMMVIFALYSLAFVLVLGSRLVNMRKI